MRDASYPGALLTIPSGAQLTLSHITLDGGAIWSGEPDTTLERGTDNSGLKAHAPLITVEGSLIMSTGAALQNNDNASSPGGAIYVSANGTMTMYDGVIAAIPPVPRTTAMAAPTIRRPKAPRASPVW